MAWNIRNRHAKNSRIMTEEETEYKGGIWNFVAGLAATAVGITATVLGEAGAISKKDAAVVSGICDVVSVCTMGIGVGTVVKAGTAVAKGASTAKVLGKTKDAWDTLGTGLAGACGDGSQYALSKSVTLATR